MNSPVDNILKYFRYEHLPADLQKISKLCHTLAIQMTKECEHNAELTAGLRKLLEAKDCFVRANLDTLKKSQIGLGGLT